MNISAWHANVRTLGLLACFLVSPNALATSAQNINEQCADDPSLEATLRGKHLQDLNIVFSNQLVKPNMKAIGAPSGSAADRVQSWLAVYGLSLIQTGSGNHLVVRDQDPPRVIAGKLLDSEGKAFASQVFRISGAARARTSQSGCYVFLPEIATGEHYLDVSGYYLYSISPTEERWHLVQLQTKRAGYIEEVSIVGSSHSMMQTHLSTENYLTRNDIERFPHLGDDITRIFRHLPGTSSGDYSPKINLRGGQQNEHVLLLDGHELHQPWYFKGLGGLVSIIDSNIIGTIDLLSGGYTAEYGGRTSGITTVETLDGAEAPTAVGVGTMASYAQAGGSSAHDQFGWLTSARMGYLDLAFNDYSGPNTDIHPRYYDFLGKFSQHLGDNNKLTVNLLTAHDTFELYLLNRRGVEQIDDNSSNDNLWITLHTDFSPSLSATNILASTETAYRKDGYYEQPAVTWMDDRHYKGVAFSTAWQAKVSSETLFKWGATVRDMEADYDYALRVNLLPEHANIYRYQATHRETHRMITGQDRHAHIAYRFRLFGDLTTELGGHWSQHTYDGSDDQTLFGPRFNTLYQLSDSTEAIVSWGRFHQPQAIDELYIGDGQEAFFKAQETDHATFGLRHRLSEHWNLRLDLYRKDYNQVLPRYENYHRNITRFINEAATDRIIVAPDSAVAQGFEAGFQYESHASFRAWANYSYSKAYDKFEDREVPRAWDQRHTLNFNLNWRIDNWNISLTGLAHSGWPTTPLGAEVTGDTATPLAIENYHSERQGPYHRFDTRITRTVSFRNGDSFQIYFDVYNLLDTTNECCYSYGTNPQGEEFRENETWLERLPSFGIRYIF